MSWPVSDAFKTALKTSHTPTYRVEILEAGVVKASTDAVGVQRILVDDGTVVDDRKAEVGRHTADWTIVDTTGAFAPLTTLGLLHPLIDREVRLWRGILGVSAATTLGDPADVPLATVQLEKSNPKQSQAGIEWSLSGTDRSNFLSTLDWRAEMTIAAGTTPYAATVAILAAVDPGYTYTVLNPATTYVTPAELVFLPGEDPGPWEAIRKIWEGAAMEASFDQMGRVDPHPIPNALTDPIAWSFLDDSQSARIAPLDVQIDRTTLRNGVIVEGSAPWLLFGVTGEAWDTDPASSSYYDPLFPLLSKVGPHAERIQDPLVGSAAEANALAAARLPDYLGIEEQFTIVSWVLPHLEAGDVIEARNALITPLSRFIYDRLDFGLRFDAEQTGVTRRRTR